MRVVGERDRTAVEGLASLLEHEWLGTAMRRDGRMKGHRCRKVGRCLGVRV